MQPDGPVYCAIEMGCMFPVFQTDKMRINQIAVNNDKKQRVTSSVDLSEQQAVSLNQMLLASSPSISGFYLGIRVGYIFKILYKESTTK